MIDIDITLIDPKATPFPLRPENFLSALRDSRLISREKAIKRGRKKLTKLSVLDKLLKNLSPGQRTSYLEAAKELSK